MSILITCLRTVVNFFTEIVFGCSHGRVTRPFTIGDETYKVCLDCGKQLYYSAQEMRPLSLGEVRRLKATHAGEVRVVPMQASVSQLVTTGDHKPHAA